MLLHANSRNNTITELCRLLTYLRQPISLRRSTAWPTTLWR